jgi:hypothetical protein
VSDRVLFISWGEPIAGREAHSIDVFNEALALDARLQQEGRIDSFDVVILRNQGPIEGYIVLHGSAEQIAALPEDDEFMRSMISASLVVHDFRMADGYTGEAVGHMMSLYQEAVESVPQPAS